MSTVDRRSSEDTAWANDGDPNSARDLTGVTLGDFQVEKLLGREEWVKSIWPRN